MPEKKPRSPDAAISWDHRRLPDPFAVLAGIFNSAMDAIITVDSSQTIVLFNPAAERLFGYPAADVLGEPLDVLIPRRLRDVHREHIENFGLTGVTQRSMSSPGILMALRAGGTEFPIEATISQAYSDGQKFFSVILREITAVRRSGQESANGK